MELFLVRHGEAKSALEDPDCSLTERGIEGVRRIATWAKRQGVQVDQIRHSGKRRAAQTATLLAERLQPREGVIAVTGLCPEDSPESLAASLAVPSIPLLLVSHLPILPSLAAVLLNGSGNGPVPRFRNAELACLGHRDGRWTLVWTVAPDSV